MKVLLVGSSGMVGRNIQAATPREHELLCPGRDTLDLLDKAATYKYVKEHKPDFIIHSAGIVGGIKANIENPVKFLTQNVEIGNNIINAARDCGVKKFLNLGSSCIYPKDSNEKLRESDILGGHLEPTNEGYAIAKIFALRLCEYISRENQYYHYKTIIPCNLYGKWDKFVGSGAHMIPAVIDKTLKAKLNGQPSIQIWGDGTARREFMYAGDLADFIWFAVENFSSIPSVLNVGLGFDYSILEYYDVIKEVTGFEGEFTFDLTKPVGMKRKLVDNSNLHSLGWQPKHSLTEGLEKTIQFYKENYL